MADYKGVIEFQVMERRFSETYYKVGNANSHEAMQASLQTVAESRKRLMARQCLITDVWVSDMDVRLDADHDNEFRRLTNPNGTTRDLAGVGIKVRYNLSNGNYATRVIRGNADTSHAYLDDLASVPTFTANWTREFFQFAAELWRQEWGVLQTSPQTPASFTNIDRVTVDAGFGTYVLHLRANPGIVAGQRYQLRNFRNNVYPGLNGPINTRAFDPATNQLTTYITAPVVMPHESKYNGLAQLYTPVQEIVRLTEEGHAIVGLTVRKTGLARKNELSSFAPANANP